MNTSEKQLSMQMILKIENQTFKKYRNTNKDLREWVEHAEDHPDVDHLGVRGGRQGAGEPDKAVR